MITILTRSRQAVTETQFSQCDRSDIYVVVNLEMFQEIVEFDFVSPSIGITKVGRHSVFRDCGNYKISRVAHFY